MVSQRTREVLLNKRIEKNMKQKREYIKPLQKEWCTDLYRAMAFDVDTSGVDEVGEGEVGSKEREENPDELWWEIEKKEGNNIGLW